MMRVRWYGPRWFWGGVGVILVGLLAVLVVSLDFWNDEDPKAGRRAKHAVARSLPATSSPGERLPDGTIADAVYLVLNEAYLDILNHAPVRPLDYAYLKALTPMAQRFYEIVSYKIFPALKYHHPHATLRYTEYCLLSTQQRYTDAIQVQKQMYKVHRPHLDAGYLVKAQYEATTDAHGQPDWLLHYTPGPKAKAEYAAFMRQPGAEAAAALTLSADADQADLVATVTREPPVAPPPPPAVASTPPGAALAIQDAAARPAPLPEPPLEAEAGTPVPGDLHGRSDPTGNARAPVPAQ